MGIIGTLLRIGKGVAHAVASVTKWAFNRPLLGIAVAGIAHYLQKRIDKRREQLRYRAGLTEGNWLIGRLLGYTAFALAVGAGAGYGWHHFRQLFVSQTGPGLGASRVPGYRSPGVWRDGVWSWH